MSKGKQRGISLLGLIAGLFILVIVALFAMKIVPSYLQYSAAKRAIQAVAQDPQATTPHEARRAFQLRAAVDDVGQLRDTDLEITKDGNRMVISFAYRKVVPITSTFGVYIDYAASTE
jgi:hypothetical protein